jgi:hypothetical protein
MGDLNIDPLDSPTLSDAIQQGFLFDLGASSGPTFFPSHGKPRRLDVIMATRSAAPAMFKTGNVEFSGLPGHLPLATELNLDVFSEIVPRIRKPAALPVDIPVNDTLARTNLDSAGKFSFASVNDAYDCFSSVAEKYLLSASGMQSQKITGRGKAPTLVHEPRFCPQSKDGLCCEGAPLRRLKRLLRRLEHLRHFVNAGQQQSWKATRLWDNVICNRRFLQNASNLFAEVEFPHLDRLTQMIKVAQDKVQKMQANETYCRVRIAQAKVRQNWKSAPSWFALK